MRLKLVLRITITLAVTIALARAQAQDSDEVFKQKASPEAEQTAHALRAKILSETAALGRHAWAGIYYCGDGTSANIRLDIAPQSGFVYEWHGCRGLYDRNYGAVSVINGHIHLTFTFPNFRNEAVHMSDELIPVSWEGRTYLISPDEIVSFCNKVNAGFEPRTNSFGLVLLRAGDEKKRVKGFPDVPAEFKPYLLPSPVRAEITAIGKTTTRPSILNLTFIDIAVTLNAGEADGLRKGMELHVISPKNQHNSVELTKVTEHQSEGTFNWMEKTDRPPQVGWRLSTDPFDKPKPANEK